MITFIEGKVAEKNAGELVMMSAGGVGFSLMCSNATLSAAPGKGETWRCYTVMNVREDAVELFGFASRQEREMFRRLCTVTGVGAKTALGVLSALPLRDHSQEVGSFVRCCTLCSVHIFLQDNHIVFLCISSAFINLTFY